MNDANKCTISAGQLCRDTMDISPGNLFMALIVYADESGTLDPCHVKSIPSARTPVLAGYIDTKDNWCRFANEWDSVLRKYKVPYFHFRELIFERTDPKRPYYHGWNEEKVDDFVTELALVATISAIPISGFVNGPFAVQSGLDSFETMMSVFFQDFTDAISQHWPHETGPVNFIFDQKTNDVTWGTLLQSVYEQAKKFDVRIGDKTFGDKKDRQDMPLQAADMIAHRNRRTANCYFANDGNAKAQQPTTLDFLLWRNEWPAGDALSLAGMNMDEVRLMTKAMRLDEKRQRQNGDISEKQEYHINEHSDTLKVAIHEVVSEFKAQCEAKAFLLPSRHGQ